MLYKEIKGILYEIEGNTSCVLAKCVQDYPILNKLIVSAFLDIFIDVVHAECICYHLQIYVMHSKE